jgi:hypothetical protein
MDEVCRSRYILLVQWALLWHNDPIDPANKECVARAIISGAQFTDKVDLSKSNLKNEKQR